MITPNRAKISHCQNVISMNEYPRDISATWSSILSLLNVVSILYLEHFSVWTSQVSSAQEPRLAGGYHAGQCTVRPQADQILQSKPNPGDRKEGNTINSFYPGGGEAAGNSGRLWFGQANRTALSTPNAGPLRPNGKPFLPSAKGSALCQVLLGGVGGAVAPPPKAGVARRQVAIRPQQAETGVGVIPTAELQWVSPHKLSSREKELARTSPCCS